MLGSAKTFAIMGGPGSGKTTLAVSIVLERLSARAADEPVPVLIPAVTWDPFVEGLKTWIERQLRERGGRSPIPTRTPPRGLASWLATSIVSAPATSPGGGSTWRCGPRCA
ncbi:hypothetical protein ACFSKW_48365 [Nonomuraea mangrovi]|uniref:UvrD-like helicase ATP-binding domain-containing protein n=1 Tax=Nonomuraea mangrovi TaxID=2316207 RepID=A0ABW4TBC0_9ACTN